LLSPKVPENLKEHVKYPKRKTKFQASIANIDDKFYTAVCRYYCFGRSKCLMIPLINRNQKQCENLIKTPKNHLSVYASAKPSQTENHKHAQPAIFNKFSCKALLYSIFTGSY
jgi:hypothetical protein